MVFTIAVTGWWSAKTRTTSGIDLVGTNAELRKGGKISGYEKAVAPSVDLAVSPAITATQVSASVNTARMPTTASQDRMPADERKPISNATSRIHLVHSSFSSRPDEVTRTLPGLQHSFCGFLAIAFSNFYQLVTNILLIKEMFVNIIGGKSQNY